MASCQVHKLMGVTCMGCLGVIYSFSGIRDCDEWGGAESRGNGARPVEWMIMNDTCATHRSRVPRRSFGRNKRRSDDIGSRERGPGLGFSLCFVCGSRPWGAAAFLLCLFIWLLNVFKCSPVPASFFPYISTSLQRCNRLNPIF